VWHASGRGSFVARARGIALVALEGVGDESLGQWEEQGNGGVYHIRRRLSVEEQKVIGDAIDIRGTPEERARLDVLLAEVHPLVAKHIVAMRLHAERRRPPETP
jgi:hypothetical protein